MTPDPRTSPGVVRHGIVRVWETNPPGTWVTPNIVSTLPELWRILNRILDGWLRDVADCRAHHGTEDFYRFYEMKWPFIQAFFTYITFLFMLEKSYLLLYTQLKALTRDLGVQLTHNKLTTRPPYLERLWLIRNKSVAHFASSNPHPDDIAGAMLGVFTKNKDGVPDLENICFGGATVGGAVDRDSKSLPETHRLCSEYLKTLDGVCDSYYLDILHHLPITVGSRSYRAVGGGHLWPDNYFDLR